MHHAGDWFDGWKDEIFKGSAPEYMTYDNRAKLYARCEEWAKKKRLDGEKDAVAMDIGELEEEGYDWNQIGYVLCR